MRGLPTCVRLCAKSFKAEAYTSEHLSHLNTSPSSVPFVGVPPTFREPSVNGCDEGHAPLTPDDWPRFSNAVNFSCLGSSMFCSCACKRWTDKSALVLNQLKHVLHKIFTVLQDSCVAAPSGPAFAGRILLLQTRFVKIITAFYDLQRDRYESLARSKRLAFLIRQK